MRRDGKNRLRKIQQSVCRQPLIHHRAANAVVMGCPESRHTAHPILCEMECLWFRLNDGSEAAIEVWVRASPWIHTQSPVHHCAV